MPAFYKEFFYRGKLSLIGKMLGKPQPKPVTFTGPGSRAQLSKAIGQFGIKSVLIVTDKPLRELGILDDTIETLTANGVSAQVYDGVLPDPTQQVVDDGIAMLKQHGCEGVLAFGGGSSIDCAKVIALGSANNG